MDRAEIIQAMAGIARFGLKTIRLHLVFELEIAARLPAALRRARTVLDKHNGQERIHKGTEGDASITRRTVSPHARRFHGLDAVA